MKKIWLLLLFPARLFAQEFTGTWTGWLEVGGVDIPYELVIFEGESGLEGYAMTTAVLNDVKNTGIKTVKFNIKNKKLQLEDDELVFSDFSKPPKRNILAAELSIEESGPVTELTGSYRTRSADMRDRTSYKGKIFLKKVKSGEKNELTARLNDLKLLPLKERFVYREDVIAKNAASLSEKKKNEEEKKEAVNEKRKVNAKQDRKEENDIASGDKADAIREKENTSPAITESTKEKNKKNESVKNDQAENKGKEKPNLTVESGINAKNSGKAKVDAESYYPAPAANLDSRKIEVIHNYYVSGDSLEITFYDNGTVDGDTISVLLNRKIIIAKRQLTDEPLTEKISFPKDADSLELIMYAENLGSYPPNTGILIIKDENGRADIRFAGDLIRSSSIILRRKK